VRARAIAAIVALVALWPLVHRVLVVELDVNPWKLGGFAMYTTPRPPLLVVLFTRQGEHLAPIDERTLPTHVRRQLHSFRARRHALGKRVQPDELARALFDARPRLEGLLVVVQNMRLDRETARMISTKDHFAYTRADFSDSAFSAPVTR
jgi:hypothetical protein